MIRDVRCVVQLEDGSRETVLDHKCTSSKPDTEMKCNTQECSQWFEGPWSKV